ncbi:MAG: hypothetical protein JXR68_11245 [Bacteroidales bacterium]|nr:hypothetical protein [Bacteroidales bacterium]
MENFTQTIEKSQFNESGFVNHLKGHLGNNGIRNNKASIKTGYSVGTTNSTFRDDNYNTIGTGSSTHSSSSYSLYDNPFDISFKHNTISFWGTYKGRIQVSLLNDYFLQEGAKNNHYYNYRVNGSINWVHNSAITKGIIFGGIILGIIIAIAAQTGAVFSVFLFLSLGGGLASSLYSNSEGRKYIGEVTARINSSLTNYKE